jgi:hypothetical protein
MEVHFVAVEVCVIGFADAFVKAEGPIWANSHPMGKDTEFMEGRLTVE